MMAGGATCGRGCRAAAKSTYLIPHGALEFIFKALVAARAIEFVGDPVIAGRGGNV